jgi:nicotinamide mononucleotide transporter
MFTQSLVVMEAAATLLGIFSVYLLSVGNGKGWPVGAAMIALTGVVYAGGGLYGSATLQIFFFGTQLLGWHRWRKSDEKDLRKSSRSLTLRKKFAVILLVTGLWSGLWVLLERAGGTAAPVDAFVTAGSLVAQVLMVGGFRECWPLWLLVDIVYVVLSFQQQLYAFMLLYLVFCVMAWNGWRQWTRDLDE